METIADGDDDDIENRKTRSGISIKVDSSCANSFGYYIRCNIYS